MRWQDDEPISTTFFYLDIKEPKNQDSRRQSLLWVVTGSFRSAAFTFDGRLSVLLL
jgi:hypothetical protein